MSTIRVTILGQQVGEPVGWQNMKTTLDFNKDKDEPTISLDRITLVGAAATLVIDHLEQFGYRQGIPFVVESGDPQSPSMTINGYLDPSDNPIVKGPNEIEIALKRRQGYDWLVERADSFSFRELASSEYDGNGKIIDADYTRVPYIINYIPDGMQLLMLGISTFMIAKELIDSVKSIATQTTDLIEGLTPSVGANAGGPVTSWSLGKIIGNILKLAVTIAYTVGIIVALVKLIDQIIEQLAPVKRHHLGMGIKDLAQKGCDHLGIELKSDLLDSLANSQKWAIIPTKGHKGGSPPTGTDINDWTESGVPNANDGVDSLGDLIRFIETTFNAEHKMSNGVLEIERKDHWQGQSSYVIPDTLTNQETLQDEISYNTDDLSSNVVISWSDDQQDQNTLFNQNGRVYQAVTYVETVTDPDLVSLAGMKRISIPMSLAVRKDELTAIEKVLKVFLQAADFLSGQLDEPQSFASKFNARIGSMHLASHFTGLPKMVVLEGTQLAPDQRSIMSAQKLWETKHFIDSHVTIDNKNAQQVIYKKQKIPFCDADFLSLQNNNFVTIKSGEIAEVKKIEWHNYENEALIDYNVYRIYDENLAIKYLTK